jgi:hypothetical protein
MNAPVKINELSVKIFSVLFPCHAVDAWCRALLHFEEDTAETVDGDVVQKRCQFLLFVSVYSFAYARLRLGHDFPALCPARALQTRIPFGPITSLIQLRCGSHRFVRRFRRYY